MICKQKFRKTPRMNDDSLDPEHKTRNKGKMSARSDMLPSNDSDVAMMQSDPESLQM